MSVFISLTTVPKRLAEINSMVENITSLINQKTDVEYKIIFNIPYTYSGDGTPYVIPDELTKLAQDNPKLILNRIETDRGPIEKYLDKWIFQNKTHIEYLEKVGLSTLLNLDEY